MVGKIVELVTEEGQIFNCMITETDVKIDTGKQVLEYDYRGVFYPAGFLGFSGYWEFNKDNIYKVIFQPKYETIFNKLDISSIVKYNNDDYLVVGYNVRYAGMNDDLYACIKIGDTSFNITYLKQEDIILLPDAKQDIINLKDRVSNVRKNLREYNALLPIGSVVTLLVDDTHIDVSIIARNITIEGERVDYLGIHPELGFRGFDKTVRFNMNNVYEVLYLGYYNDKEFDLHLQIVTDNDMQRR
jgi:hypothetical protein